MVVLVTSFQAIYHSHAQQLSQIIIIGLDIFCLFIALILCRLGEAMGLFPFFSGFSYGKAISSLLVLQLLVLALEASNNTSVQWLQVGGCVWREVEELNVGQFE